MTQKENDIKTETTTSQSKFKRFVMWLLINGGMCYALYMAMMFQNEMAANLIKFIVWLNFIMIILVTIAGKELKQKAREQGPSVPYKINLVYGVLFSCVLAAFGWFGYAALDIIATFLQGAIYSDEDDT